MLVVADGDGVNCRGRKLAGVVVGSGGAAVVGEKERQGKVYQNELWFLQRLGTLFYISHRERN